MTEESMWEYRETVEVMFRHLSLISHDKNCSSKEEIVLNCITVCTWW